MTLAEFEFQINRLKATFPNQFPDERVVTIFSFVKDLDAKWFQKVCSHMIMVSNPRLDISEAARNERNAKAAQQFTEDVVAAHEKMKARMTDEGYSSALQKFNASNLLEAVQNSAKHPERTS
jgi:hypothetical protein